MPPQLGDFRRLKLEAYKEWHPQHLHLELMFSKDGIPTFECSSKPACLAEKNIPSDFLWVDNVPSYPSYQEEAQKWWSDLGDRVLRDRFNWHLVQQAMAKFSCLVDIKAKPGAEWVEFPAEEAVTRGATASGSTRSVSGSGAGKNRRRGQKGGRTGSGLGKEISQG